MRLRARARHLRRLIVRETDTPPLAGYDQIDCRPGALRALGPRLFVLRSRTGCAKIPRHGQDNHDSLSRRAGAGRITGVRGFCTGAVRRLGGDCPLTFTAAGRPVLSLLPLNAAATSFVTVKVLSTTNLADWAHAEEATLTVGDNGTLTFDHGSDP